MHRNSPPHRRQYSGEPPKGVRPTVGGGEHEREEEREGQHFEHRRRCERREGGRAGCWLKRTADWRASSNSPTGNSFSTTLVATLKADSTFGQRFHLVLFGAAGEKLYVGRFGG